MGKLFSILWKLNNTFGLIDKIKKMKKHKLLLKLKKNYTIKILKQPSLLLRNKIKYYV